MEVFYGFDNPPFAAVVAEETGRTSFGRSAIDVVPLVIVVAIFTYFSAYPISAQVYAATATNSSGLIAGNFVYDTAWNTPFIFASVFLVEFVSFIYPKTERWKLTYSFPLVILGSAIAANWLVFQTPYVKPLYCINCRVSGMSAVASAAVGTTFVLAVGTSALILRARRAEHHEDEMRGFDTWLYASVALAVVASATVYLWFLSFFAGQSAATEFVHAASFALGLVISLVVLSLPFQGHDLAQKLAGSKKFFFAVILLTIVVIGVASPVYPVQYQTYSPSSWAGYVAFGNSNGSVTSVTGEWVVPTVNCTSSHEQAVLFWVGMDGIHTKTVEQGGTKADCVDGVAAYSAWHEFWPVQPSTLTFVTLRISPGNLIRATVDFHDGEFNITVSDLSTNQSSSYVGSYEQGQRLDAEWIVEAPGYLNGTRLALPSFGQVRFNESYAVVGGSMDSIGSVSNGSVLYYCTGNDYRLVPSNLGTGWDTFTVFSLNFTGC